ncbi:2-isopropylmalate synthase [Acuticoccus sediminis]|uniref:2-isopropylmalate synthase n=1 Tax=Acuticoccus sediminis TaxID=2184697 RepID=A0A8B2NH02_9HYPH|nr:2-isopropylmalate synthase [Acuticoccus sediminis]RAH98411.1 2-isopropylmalate synthase [Acuticoccus sediminis]
MSDQIKIFDTTLRDGEQSAGATMTHDEKVQIALTLDEMKVDVIEAGFPIASQGDFEAVSEIARQVQFSVVAGLARAVPGDIARAGEAVRHAKRPRIHTFVSTSPIHLQHQMRATEDEVVEIIARTVTQARDLVDDVEWSGMDATRTPLEYLARCVRKAIECGATTINLPDTVGYATPTEYREMFEYIRRECGDDVTYSTHCHNDLGLAVANSLAGIEGGARQVECTINGLGERAGNAALEEVVMALKVRGDVMPWTTGVDATQLMRASKLVSVASGFQVQYNKAIVGKNAFAHESGIHQDGMLKHAETYEIMRPEDVGVRSSSLVMGKHSGRHAFKTKLKELGFELGDNALQDAFRRFKDLADRKKNVYDEDIEALLEDQIEEVAERARVMSLTVIAGTGGPQKAILVMDVEGRHVTEEATGNGPVDAVFNAVKKIVPHEAKLSLYQVHAVTEGTDAQAEVSVRLEHNGRIESGRGADVDTLVASAKAYVAAVNKLQARRRMHAQGATPGDGTVVAAE